MEKRSQVITEGLKSRFSSKGEAESEEARPVKWVQISKNVWQIVYAD